MLTEVPNSEVEAPETICARSHVPATRALVGLVTSLQANENILPEMATAEPKWAPLIRGVGLVAMGSCLGHLEDQCFRDLSDL